MVSGELAEVAKKFGTPRRTVLLEGSGAALPTAVPLEVADDPCVVLMSATGLVARVPVAGPARLQVIIPNELWFRLLQTRAARPTMSSSPRSGPPPAARSAW